VPEDDVISRCVRVFGVASVSPAVQAPKDNNDIGRLAADFMNVIIKNEDIKTFKVKAKRADKSFSVQSPEIARQVGGMVLHKITDLIRDNRTAVFRHEDDVVSKKVDGMSFSVVFHIYSLVRGRPGYEKRPCREG
jgi:adenylyl- and sulfurtransferase ThiI